MTESAATMLTRADVDLTSVQRVGKVHTDLAFAQQIGAEAVSVIFADTLGRTHTQVFTGPHALRVANGWIAQHKRGERTSTLETA